MLAVPFLFNLFLYFARNRKVEHLWELIIYQTITVLLSLLFPIFFVVLLSFPRRSIALAVAVNAVVLFFVNDFWNMFNVMSLVVLILSSGHGTMSQYPGNHQTHGGGQYRVVLEVGDCLPVSRQKIKELRQILDL